ncbi:MAG: hypothetical protein G01um101438_354 [Parcubacteria group bacterium Gr01-1014_38]|nr:MAG: hypothetical protein G01um101438_354 [Parcubacteria group bacterium Gr01-1014_38]
MMLPEGKGSKFPGSVPRPFFVLAALIAGGSAFVFLLLLAAFLRHTAVPDESLAQQLAAKTVAPKQVLGVDTDGDKQPDRTDLDDDNDGYADIHDPLPTSVRNLDNDELPDAKDTDDDNDGIPDKTDRYPLDQNNNGESDTLERRRLGRRFDGDRDGKPDIAEWVGVARAEARKLGVVASDSWSNFADIPKEVLRHLPEGWYAGVCADRDNDGIPDGQDKVVSGGGSYESYTHGGKWEKQYVDLAAKKDAITAGFIDRQVVRDAGLPCMPEVDPGCAFSEQIRRTYEEELRRRFGSGKYEIPRYETPKDWPPPGYVPGSGLASSGGSDPYASFYGSIPEHEKQYYPTHQYSTSGGSYPSSGQYSSGGTSEGYTPPSGGYYSAPPPDSGVHYYSEPPPPPPPLPPPPPP